MTTQQVVYDQSTRKSQLIASTGGGGVVAGVDFTIRANARRTSVFWCSQGNVTVKIIGASFVVAATTATRDLFTILDVKDFGDYARSEIVINPAAAIVIFETYVEGEIY